MEQTIILIFAGQAVVVVGKIIFDWLSQNRNGNSDSRLKSIENIIAKTDEDGTPLIYSPRSWEKQFDKMVKHLENIEKGINGK